MCWIWINPREKILVISPGKLKNNIEYKIVLCLEKYQARKSHRDQCDVIIDAFLRLELQRMRKGISWFESKTKICRAAATA